PTSQRAFSLIPPSPLIAIRALPDSGFSLDTPPDTARNGNGEKRAVASIRRVSSVSRRSANAESDRTGLSYPARAEGEMVCSLSYTRIRPVALSEKPEPRHPTEATYCARERTLSAGASPPVPDPSGASISNDCVDAT